MWGNILTDYSFNSNFNIQFPNTKSDILIHLSQWQYWWWFWFSFFWVLYYLFLAKVLRNRTLKFRPKIVSSFRPHGKWGDLIICLLPISWCFNILVNSNFLLKLLEWQAESSLFTIRIRGKQWYWVYKFDFKNFTDIISTPKNVGSNKWIFSFFGDLKTADNYLHILQMRSQNKWIKGYWLSNLNKFTDEKKNNLNYLDNNLIVNKNVIKNKTNFFFKNKNFSNCNTTLLSKLFIKKNIFNKKVDLKEKIKLTNIILLKKSFLIKEAFVKKRLNSTINNKKPILLSKIFIKKKVFDNTKLTKTNHLMTKKKHILRLLKLSILREKEFLFNSIFLKKISSEKDGLFLNKTYVKENFLKLLKKSFSKNEDIMKKKLNNFVKTAIKYIDKKKKPVNIKLRNLNKNLNENFLKENFFKKKNIIKKKLNSTIPSTEKQINIKKKNQSLKKFTLTKSLKEKFLQKSFYRKNTTLKKKPLVFHKNFFLKYANKNKNLFFKKKKFLNNFSKKNFNFNFLKKKKQIFKNFSYEINFFKLYNTQFNFKKFTNSEEPTRLLKNSMGGDLNVTLVKKNYKNDKNFNNKNYLFKLRFDKDISYKNTPKASYFTFKQKRYKRRTLIQPFVKNYKNDLKKDLKLKSNFNLNKNYIMEDNIKNPTKYYRMLKKNKTRSENMPITISKRLLRVKRTLVIPTHINITAITNSYDVVHSWFIPGLGLKMDCVPGRSTHHTFYVDNAGFYYGQCAEICGRYHHHMPIRVCALPFEHFLIWWNSFGLTKFMFNSKDYKNIKIYSFRKFVW